MEASSDLYATAALPPAPTEQNGGWAHRGVYREMRDGRILENIYTCNIYIYIYIYKEREREACLALHIVMPV
jgi:hypothetical protein